MKVRVTRFCTPDSSDTHRNTHMLHVSARRTLETRTASHASFHLQWLFYYCPNATKSWNMFTDISGSEIYHNIKITGAVIQPLSAD